MVARRMEWWSISFEFLLLLIMLVTAFLRAFERARFVYLAFLCMVSVLLQLTANRFITNSFVSGGLNFADYKQVGLGWGGGVEGRGRGGEGPPPNDVAQHAGCVQRGCGWNGAMLYL